MKREPIKSTNKPKKIARKTIKGIDSVSSVGKPKKWKRVKIAGNLVSDDGGGLEGLIGLEVMEDYGNNTVTKDKVIDWFLFLERLRSSYLIKIST